MAVTETLSPTFETERRASVAVLLLALAAIGGAWYSQLVWGLAPCELCLLQRWPYYIGVPLAAVAVAFASKPKKGRLVGFLLSLLALIFLASAGLAAYHAGVEWGFWTGPTDCSGPVVNLGSASDMLSRLDTVKVIRCDEVQWRYLGISLAGYNVLISLLMAAIAAWGCVRTARR